MSRSDDNKNEGKKEASFSFIGGPPPINKNWCCPICQNIFRNPVYLNGNKNFTFCKYCIDKWWERCDNNHQRRTNPLTNIRITKDSAKLLTHNIQLAKDIKHFFTNVAAKMNDPPQYCCNERLPKQSAQDAQDFFEKHLSHLKPEYETMARWSEKIAESWYRVMYTVNSYMSSTEDSSSDSKQDYQQRIDNLKEQAYQSIDIIFESGQQELNDAESEEDAAAVVRRLQRNVGFETKIWEGIVAMAKTVWKGLKWCYETVRDSIRALFAWISGWF